MLKAIERGEGDRLKASSPPEREASEPRVITGNQREPYDPKRRAPARRPGGEILSHGEAKLRAFPPTPRGRELNYTDSHARQGPMNRGPGGKRNGRVALSSSNAQSIGTSGGMGGL